MIGAKQGPTHNYKSWYIMLDRRSEPNMADEAAKEKWEGLKPELVDRIPAEAKIRHFTRLTAIGISFGEDQKQEDIEALFEGLPVLVEAESYAYAM